MPTEKLQPRRFISTAIALASFMLVCLLIPIQADAAKVRKGACAPVTGKVSQKAKAKVLVVKRRGISCQRARQVVRRCFTRSSVKHWQRAGKVRLRAGKRVIRLKVRGKGRPACLHTRKKAPRVKRPPLLGAPSNRTAGPYQEPSQMPPRSYTNWYWVSPVNSWEARQIDVGTAQLYGKVLNKSAEARSVWFEYGITRDLGMKTERQPVPVNANGNPVSFDDGIRGLKASTRYYWRAMASIGPDHAPQTYTGAIGSFVTESYRDMSSANPCNRPIFGGVYGGVTQVTGSLAIVCSPMRELVNDKKIVASVGYHGRLTCPVEYPHNLNAGSFTVTLPEINYNVTFNNLVNYWRSNDSARFTTFPGYQKHYKGAEVGPLVGWHDWDIDQWGYLFKTSRTDVQLWIHCTDNWKAQTPAQLAPPQGRDKPSDARPPTPTGFKYVKVDGGWKASWDAAGGVADGIAGYQFAVLATDKPTEAMSLRLTDAGTETFRPDAFVKAMADIFQTKDLYALVWAISSEGNRSAKPAVIPFKAS